MTRQLGESFSATDVGVRSAQTSCENPNPFARRCVRVRIRSKKPRCFYKNWPCAVYSSTTCCRCADVFNTPNPLMGQTEERADATSSAAPLLRLFHSWRAIPHAHDEGRQVQFWCASAGIGISHTSRLACYSVLRCFVPRRQPFGTSNRARLTGVKRAQGGSLGLPNYPLEPFSRLFGEPPFFSTDYRVRTLSRLLGERPDLLAGIRHGIS